MNRSYETLKDKIEFLHEPTKDAPFAVIIKPRGLPSAPLFEGDESAFTQAAFAYPELKSVRGKKECEHGLIHRIDTDTEGILIMASSQEFYDYMMLTQNEGKFIKSYKAICKSRLVLPEGFPDITNQIEKVERYGELIVTAKSMFRPYGKKNREVRPVIIESGKAAQKKSSKIWYTTDIKITKAKEKNYFAECVLTKGYRHQVRCHLSWLGFPIVGDILYATQEDNISNSDFKFWATKIEFPYKEGSVLKQKVFEYSPKNI